MISSHENIRNNFGLLSFALAQRFNVFFTSVYNRQDLLFTRPFLFLLLAMDDNRSFLLSIEKGKSAGLDGISVKVLRPELYMLREAMRSLMCFHYSNTALLALRSSLRSSGNLSHALQYPEPHVTIVAEAASSANTQISASREAIYA